MLRKEVDRPVVRHHVHAVENRLMDTWDGRFDFGVRVLVDEHEGPQFAIGNVEAVKFQARLPFLKLEHRLGPRRLQSRGPVTSSSKATLRARYHIWAEADWLIAIGATDKLSATNVSRRQDATRRDEWIAENPGDISNPARPTSCQDSLDVV
jgi:hypothetical protein